MSLGLPERWGENKNTVLSEMQIRGGRVRVKRGFFPESACCTRRCRLERGVGSHFVPAAANAAACGEPGAADTAGGGRYPQGTAQGPRSGRGAAGIAACPLLCPAACSHPELWNQPWGSLPACPSLCCCFISTRKVSPPLSSKAVGAWG